MNATIEGRLAELPAQLAGLVNEGAISGVVTLVWKDGRVIHRAALGHRDIEAGRPMERDTIFRIASMTKPIVSAAALTMMEEGAFALDDPIERWLPEFANPFVLLDPAGPLDRVEPAQRAITVRDLMTHRSGLAYLFSSTGPIARAYDERFGDVPGIRLHPDEWLRRIASLPLLYQPGERLHYGHSHEVLGFLIARIAGKGLEHVLEERIFEPLGMRDTGFHVPPGKRDRLAKLYRPGERGLERVEIAIPDTTPLFCAGGGMLVSTADDYLAFARFLLGSGEVDGVRLLKTDTVRDMLANQLSEGQRRIPFLGKPYWTGMGFGLGISVIMDPVKHRWMGRGHRGAFGWPGVWGTWWQADPELDAVMIYLLQHAAPVGPEVIARAERGEIIETRPGLPLFQHAVYGPA